MARHRAPDVASPLHEVRPSVTGRPRHAAGPAKVAGPDARAGRHRGQASAAERTSAATREGARSAIPTLEFLAPLVVAVPDPTPPEPVAVQPTPVSVLEPAPVPLPEVAPVSGTVVARRQPLAEVVAWSGFAFLVSCVVVAGGQGPREEAVWTLGGCGGVLSIAGLALIGSGRRRAKRDAALPQ